ncbi:hypothetical protein SLE2022_191310 [Rubroshorea leprosula]
MLYTVVVIGTGGSGVGLYVTLDDRGGPTFTWLHRSSAPPRTATTRSTSIPSRSSDWIFLLANSHILSFYDPAKSFL